MAFKQYRAHDSSVGRTMPMKAAGQYVALRRDRDYYVCGIERDRQEFFLACESEWVLSTISKNAGRYLPCMRYQAHCRCSPYTCLSCMPSWLMWNSESFMQYLHTLGLILLPQGDT